MKNIFITTAALCLLLFACKKEQVNGNHQSKTDIKKYAVSFALSGFTQSEGTINQKKPGDLISSKTPTTSSLSTLVNNILYVAYDAAGNEVGRIRQFSDALPSETSYKFTYGDDMYFKPYTNPFGSIVDSLPAGTYTIVIVGSKYKFAIDSRHNDDPTDYLSRDPLSHAFIGDERSISYQLPLTKDTFFKKFTLNVAADDVIQPVTLERITGKVEINILDAIPANAYRFEFRFINAVNLFEFNTQTAHGNTYYEDPNFNYQPVQILPTQIGITNYRFKKYIFGSDQVCDVELRCFDSSGAIIASKTVTGVHIYRNRRTSLRGRLFDTGVPTGFSISVDTAWGADAPEVTF